VTLSTPRNEFDHLVVPLKGEHQAHNCGLALAILDKLSEHGFKTPTAKVTRGLAETRLAGRFELAWKEPRVVLDGAHNADSLRQLMKTLAAQLRYDSLVVVFGCAADKDIGGMLRELVQGADKVIFTKAHGNARAAEPTELQRRLAESGKMSQVGGDMAAAMGLAGKAVGREDLICVTGSLYLVADAKRHLAQLAAKRG
jgi:dihydrofolate synthase/folylpolyglutamate synthase